MMTAVVAVNIERVVSGDENTNLFVLSFCSFVLTVINSLKFPILNFGEKFR